MIPPHQEPGASAGVRAIDGDWVIASKLAVPRVQVPIVGRPRVDARLDEAAQGAVGLVCAPAGYGKTVAVSSWLKARRRDAAWVTVDAGDDDPARLWTHVAAAVARVRAGAGDDALALLRGIVPRVREGTAALATKLADDDEPLVIVLDDVHLIGDARCLRSIDYAIAILPAHVSVIAVSRTPTQIGPSGAPVNLGPAELAFTAEEARGLFAPASPASDVAQLTRRTEGWAAGLRLASLWLAQQDDPVSAAARFAGDHRWVADYLAEQVIDGLDIDARQFLVRTSPLSRLSAELCNTVLDRVDSQQVLERLRASGLLISALDDEQRWFRYHDLFREALRAQFDAQPHPVRALVSQRAGAWLEAHGWVEEAIEQALIVGAHDRAALVAERHHLELIRAGRAATLARWIDRLPDTTLATRPRIVVARLAVAAGDDISAADSERLLVATREARNRHPERWRAHDETVLEVLEGQFIDDDLGAAVAHERRGLQAARAGAAELVVPALGYFAFIAFLAGDELEAERCAAAAIAEPATGDRPVGRALAAATLALLATQRGEVTEARSLADTALATGSAAGLLDTFTGSRLLMADGATALAEGRLAHAEDTIERALRFNTVNRGATRAWMLIVLADVLTQRDRRARAHSLHRRARVLLTACSDAGRVTALADAVQRRLQGADQRLVTRGG